MNCREFQYHLQAVLDGESDTSADFRGHLGICESCRQLEAAARRLSEGLASLPVVLPADYADRVVGGVRRQRRVRTIQRTALACAASVLAALGLWFSLAGRGSLEAPAPLTPELMVAAPPFSLSPIPPGNLDIGDGVRQAGDAVAALSRRAADETLSQTRGLFPDISGLNMAASAAGVEESLEEPVRSLREAGQGMSAALEPVTDSARRAVAMFLRDIPPLTPNRQPGM